MTLPIETPLPVAPVAGGGPDDVGRVSKGLGEDPDLTRLALVVGLDLSLRRTGIATLDGARSVTPPKGLDGLARLRWIRHVVIGAVAGADLVVVEGLSYGSHQPSALERAGLWYVVMAVIDARQIRWIEAAPATRAKYATGNGRADKATVLTAAIKRLPIDVTNDDEADAAWLCAIGHDLLGQPLAQLPAEHRKGLDTVRARNEAALSTIAGDLT